MELSEIEPVQCHGVSDLTDLRVDEHSHFRHPLGQRLDNRRGLLAIDKAPAARVKVQSDGVGAGLGGCPSVVWAGYAANLYAEHENRPLAAVRDIHS